MQNLYRGLRDGIRRSRTSLSLGLLVFASAAALMFCQLTLGGCRIYLARNENPYSDYYRLLIDRTVLIEDSGYTTRDKMYCGWWGRIQEIHQYFLDITHYTAEVTGHTTAELSPIFPAGFDDEGYFLLYGITDCMELSDFARGNITLTDGRYLTAADRENKRDVCLISDQLAQLNDLQVGDTVQLQMLEDSCPFEVVGIYHDRVWRDLSALSVSYDIPANCIYVPLSVWEKANPTHCFNYQIKLNDDRLIDDIQQRVNYYTMTDGFPATFIRVSDLYAEENRGIHTIMQLFSAGQGVFALLTLLMVVLFCHSVIRSRMREYGIYLAMGASKRDLCCSTAAEFLLAAGIGLAAAVGGMLVIGRDLIMGMLNRFIGSTAAQSIQSTTSDLLTGKAVEEAVMNASLDGAFLFSHIARSSMLLLAVLIVGMMLSLLRILSVKPIRLLSVREEANT